MSNDLTAGVVRILDSANATVGTGFVVTNDGLIAACAHVVAQALGLPDDTPEPAQTEATCWTQTPHHRAG